MRDNKVKRVFTLAELLVALLVTSIVFSAVVTLAYALGSVNDIMTNTGRRQAQLRYTMLKISDLVRHSKLVYGISDDSLVFWRADDNADGQINVNELVFIQRGLERDYLRLCEYSENLSVGIGEFAELNYYDWDGVYTLLIPECENVEFNLDAFPPYTRSVSIAFDVVEDNGVHQYQISANPRCWAGYLLE